MEIVLYVHLIFLQGSLLAEGIDFFFFSFLQSLVAGIALGAI